VAIGAIFIKHMCALSDREAVQQIQENVYMQYFIGYSGFSYEPVFDPSLFVDLRKRFGADQINEINETIMGLVREEANDKKEEGPPNSNISDVESRELKLNNESSKESIDEPTQETAQENPALARENKGDLIVDATACPQDISYPTDLNLLNDAREQSENIIDILCAKIRLTNKQTIKPRTYREIARKEYLKVAGEKA
jgi:IS5 family transposase